MKRTQVTRAGLLVLSAMSVGGAGACGDAGGEGSSSPSTDAGVEADAVSADIGAGTDAGQDDAGADTASESDMGTQEQRLVFEPCELVPGQGDRLAECATLNVPLDWEDPEGEQIEVFVKRILSVEIPTTAVWYLPGGPGQPGGPNLSAFAFPQQFAPGIDIYTVDHRGTGNSTRLNCPTAEATSSPSMAFIEQSEREVCVEELVDEWGDDLRHFNGIAAAQDVIALAHAVEDEYERVILRGGSYGSLWGRRVVQIDPTAFDAAILSAVVVPEYGFGGLDAFMNASGESFFADCAEDATCRAQLGEDPVAVVDEVYEGLRNGACEALQLDPATLRQVAGDFLNQPVTRSLLPPLFARLRRCSEADVEAIANLSNAIFGGGGGDGSGGIDWPLFFHVSASEIVEDNPPTAASLNEALPTLSFATGRGADIMYMREAWPLYELPDVEMTEGFEIPMLWLHGSRDPLLPLDDVEAAAAELLSDGQQLVVMEGAGHVLTGGTPALGGGDCAFTLELNFYNDPNAEIHPCVESLVPVQFAPDADTSLQIFGDRDPWGSE